MYQCIMSFVFIHIIIIYYLCCTHMYTYYITTHIKHIYIHTHVYRAQAGVYPEASCCFNNGFWLIDLALNINMTLIVVFFILLGDEQVILKMLFGKHSEEIAASDFPLELELHFFIRISLSLYYL